MGSRRAIVYLLVVFLLGFACGALASYWADKHDWFESKTNHEHGPLKWLTRKLDLTSEQQEKLEPILDKTGQDYYRIFEKVRPEFEKVRQETRQKIRALLTEDQQAKFEELVRKIEEREARERQRYAPPETGTGGREEKKENQLR